MIVFRLPSDPSVNYIKRVIGLPGDKVVYERQRLTINGVTVDLAANGETFDHAPVYVENLDGKVHKTLIHTPGYSKKDGLYIVPEGEYFVMGDNRDQSKDSRFIGLIPEKYLVGEAVRVWMHFVPGEMPELGQDRHENRIMWCQSLISSLKSSYAGTILLNTSALSWRHSA